MEPLAINLLIWLIVATLVTSGAASTILGCRLPTTWALLLASLMLLPLTIARAHEVFWVLFTQQTIVLLGIRWCWSQRGVDANDQVHGESVDERRTRQFTVSTFFALMAFLAILIAVLVTTERAGLYQWSNLLGLGLIAGLITLGCRSLVQSKRKLLVTGALVILLIVSSAALAQLDWLLPSLRGDVGWDNSPFDGLAWMVPGWGTGDSIWWAILPAMLFLMLPIQWLIVQASTRPATSTKAWGHDRWARGLLLLYTVVLASLPAVIYYRLVAAYEPLRGLQGPNDGYTLLMKTGRDFEPSDILTTTVVPTSVAQAGAEIQRFQAQFDQITRALDLDCHAVFDWDTDPHTFSANMEDLSSLRTIARALGVKSRYERERGDYNASTEDALQICRIGHETSRGGLLIQSLVSLAMQPIGQNQLARSSRLLPDSEMANLCQRMESTFERQESFEIIDRREAAWIRQAYGWLGALPQILSELAGTRMFYTSAGEFSWRRNQFAQRTLLLECAIRAYRHAHGALPQTLHDLVPDFVCSVPSDPFSPTGQPFLYRINSESFLLYSVGPNGKDDEGTLAIEEDKAMSVFFPNGDLTLTAYLYLDEEEEPWQPAPSAAN